MSRILGTIVTILLAATAARGQFLHERTYGMEAVTVTPGGEDRAYRIMRGAIAAAPYFRAQVSEYVAEVYLKGSFDVVKISRLVRAVGGAELRKFREGENYVQESVNEIEFRAPDKYEQRVVKQLSSMPGGTGTDEQAMKFVALNTYDTEVLGGLIISPLSPGAFSHYRFRYEGYTEDRGRIVNRIAIIPKRRSQQLVSGYIFIAQDHWNVHGLDISGRLNIVAGIDFHLQTDYGEVAENVWMPTVHRIAFDARLMGSRGTMRYTASVDYPSVVENGSIRRPDTSAPTSPPAGDPPERLSNRAAYRAARRAVREIEEPRRRSLDVTEEFTDNFTVTVDSLAREPDPAFWDRVRPVALEPAELEGYRERGIAATRQPDSAAVRRNRRKTIAAKMLFGGKPVRFGERGGELVLHGVIPSRSGFNTVDGFYFGIAPVDYRKTFGGLGTEIPKTSLTVSPQVGWAINRRALLADVMARLDYAPKRRGEFSVRAGTVSRDFSSAPGNGILPFDNTVASLVFRRNYLKLYGDNFVEGENSIDLANGLSLSLAAKYALRRGLGNTSDYSFFYRGEREFTPNISIPDHRAAIVTLGVEYTPRQYYRIGPDGRRRPVRSDWPTFFVGWKKGVKGVGRSSTDFDFVSGGIRQNIDLGSPMHGLEYFIYGGGFVTKRNLQFPDYRHFDTADLPVTNSSITSIGSYRLLGSYIYSTPDRFIEAHVAYRARFLLLKLLPWFSGRLWQEGMQFHYLDTPALNNHMEIDYTVGLIWKAGIFVGFDDFKYRRVGFKLSLPIRLSRPGGVMPL